MSDVPEEDVGLIALVALLRAPHNVAWSEVEHHVANYPGWLRWVQTLHYPSKNSHMRVVSFGDASQYAYLTAEKRQALLDFFLPYSLLLDESLTPAERATRLKREAGVQPTEFCKECLHNADPHIVAAAQDVLEACNAERTLLRGVKSPETPSDQLLRTPRSVVERADTLMRSTEAVVSPSPAKRSWFQRLFWWRKTNRD